MGNGSSQRARDHLQEARFAVDVSVLAQLVGFTTEEFTARLHARDEKLGSITDKTSPSALLDLVTFQPGAYLAINKFADTVSVGDMYRPVSEARVRDLIESFNKNGIQLTTGTSLHLCVLPIPDGKSGQSVQVVLVGGHHRIRAAVRFLRLHRSKDPRFTWKSWTKRGDKGGKLRPVFTYDKVKVDLIYLGRSPTHKLLAGVSSALNCMNGDAFRTNFFDALNQVFLLSCDGMKSPDELGFAVSYFGDYHGNSKRQYIAVAVKAVAGGGHLLQVLESYFNEVVVNDPPTKRRFISFSRLHQGGGLADLRKELNGEAAPIAEVLYFGLVILLQPRCDEGNLRLVLEPQVKEEMFEAARTVKRVQNKLLALKESQRRSLRGWPTEPGTGPSIVEMTMLNVLVSFFSSKKKTSLTDGEGAGLDDDAITKLLQGAFAKAMWVAECSNLDCSVEERQKKSGEEPSEISRTCAMKLLHLAWTGEGGHRQQVEEFVSKLTPPNQSQHRGGAATVEGRGSACSTARDGEGQERVSRGEPPGNGVVPSVEAQSSKPQPGQREDSPAAKKPRVGGTDAGNVQQFPLRFVKEHIMPAEGTKSPPSVVVGAPGGSTSVRDTAAPGPAMVVLKSTAALDLANALDALSSPAVNLVVCGGDGLNSTLAAASAVEFLTSRSVMPVAIDAGTKLLFMGNDLSLPAEFEPVMLDLQKRTGETGKVQACRFHAVLGRGTMKEGVRVDPGEAVEVSFALEQDSPVHVGFWAMQRGGVNVSMDGNDPSLAAECSHPCVISSSGIVPISELNTPWKAHVQDEVWDGLDARRMALKSTYPGVSALSGRCAI